MWTRSIKRTGFLDCPGVNFVVLKSRGRDSLAITFLAADFISSVMAPGVLPRAGVIARMGEPCLAGVVARDTAILVAVSTRDTSPVVTESNKDSTVSIGPAVIDSKCERFKCARNSEEEEQV